MKKFFWLLFVIGLGLDPTAAGAQLNNGGLYDNYTEFDACKDFRDGDKNIEEERWDINFNKCLERWPELSLND